MHDYTGGKLPVLPVLALYREKVTTGVFISQATGGTRGVCVGGIPENARAGARDESIPGSPQNLPGYQTHKQNFPQPPHLPGAHPGGEDLLSLDL